MVSAGVALLLLIVGGQRARRAGGAGGGAAPRDRGARGARRGNCSRILRLSLAEGLTLAVLGAALGILIGQAELAALLSLQPQALRRLGTVELDGRVLAWTSALALVLGRALRAGAARRAAPEGRGRGARRHARREPEAAAGLPLGARGRPGGSHRRAARGGGPADADVREHPGDRPRLQGRGRPRLPHSRRRRRRYKWPAAIEGLARTVRSRAAGAARRSPAWARSATCPTTRSRTGAARGPRSRRAPRRCPTRTTARSAPASSRRPASRSLSGRAFTDADGPKTERVAVVDELLASRAWPDASPLGRRLHVDPELERRRPTPG